MNDARGPAGREPFSGVVLTGGRSSRMGTDKAFVAVGRRGMAERVAGALREAGASEVIAIGGDLGRLGALGLDARADRWPGEGPLGGLITGAGFCSEPLVVVAACDLPRLDAPTVRAVVSEMGREGPQAAAVPVVGGVRQVHLLCVRRSVVEVLEAAFATGERSIRHALSSIAVVEVAVRTDALRDADCPEDL